MEPPSLLERVQMARERLSGLEELAELAELPTETATAQVFATLAVADALLLVAEQLATEALPKWDSGL